MHSSTRGRLAGLSVLGRHDAGVGPDSRPSTRRTAGEFSWVGRKRIPNWWSVGIEDLVLYQIAQGEERRTIDCRMLSERGRRRPLRPGTRGFQPGRRDDRDGTAARGRADRPGIGWDGTGSSPYRLLRRGSLSARRFASDLQRSWSVPLAGPADFRAIYLRMGPPEPLAPDRRPQRLRPHWIGRQMRVDD